MKKIIVLCSSVLTSFMFSLNISGMTACAADGSKGTGVSKGIIIAVMIVVFIITAICSGYITYKMRKRKLDSSKEKLNSDKEK